ncbi:MAG: MFS transporter [Candidatus Nanopelagicales bacterium]
MSDIPAGSRRVLIGLCIAMGGALVGIASLNYVLTPMMSDLGIDPEDADIALAIPSIASLFVVFLAGMLGDRRGQRTVIAWMSALFIAGSIIFTLAQGLTLIVIGLLLQGIGSTAIQILVFGLLSARFSVPKERASAFGTFGMVSPFIWMCMPVLTGWVVGLVSWRWVGVIWIVSGLAIFVATQRLLPRPEKVRPIGEVWTPILAGVTVAAMVGSLDTLHSEGLAWSTFAAFAITAGLALVCAILLRRLPAPTFSLSPLRTKSTRSFLGVVIIIPLINTVFLMTIAFQYLYGLSVLQTALVMIPAQACAVLGTRLIAGPMMRRYGVPRTATIFFLLLIPAMLCAFLVQVDSPLWVPAAYVAAYNVLTVAASITVSSGLLNSDPSVPSDQLSAYRGSGVALGGVLATVLMNGLVFSLGRLFMNESFQANGLSQADSASLMSQIQDSATSPDVMSQYAVPLPSGVETTVVIQESILTGLHANAILGAALALVSVFLIRRAARTRAAAHTGA